MTKLKFVYVYDDDAPVACISDIKFKDSYFDSNANILVVDDNNKVLFSTFVDGSVEDYVQGFVDGISLLDNYHFKYDVVHRDKIFEEFN